VGRGRLEVAAYNQVHDHILQLADLLSSGLMQQFPDRFSSAVADGSEG
jgi:hypothetical protein